MSTATRVPETWELTGDDARKTLLATGRRRLVVDAFARLRYADGFSHARSLAFVMSLVFVQGGEPTLAAAAMPVKYSQSVSQSTDANGHAECSQGER